MKTTSGRKIKKPWLAKAVMKQVYALGLWGENGSKFYSGEGSHDSRLVQPYLDTITAFLTSFNNPLIVCDLGCGDFNIGKELVPLSQKYIAVDIVPELIDFNTKAFDFPNLEFDCLDIAKDDLPSGDCAIVRQVLQHLSNAEVKKIVKKLYQYKYVVLTEHLPKGDFTPNMDIISGQGIRLKKQSGLDVLQAPFHLEAQEVKPLLIQNAMAFKGQIVTTLYRMF